MFMESISESTLHALRGRVVAGGQDFRHNVAALLQQRVDRCDHGGDRRSEAFGRVRGAEVGMAGPRLDPEPPSVASFKAFKGTEHLIGRSSAPSP
jgi:hypothetical protein